MNLRQSHFESLRNLFEYGFIFRTADEGDAETFGTKTSSTTNSVEIRIWVTRQIVVDCEINALDINTAPKDIRCNADPLIELLELFVALDTGEC